jgi:hypothetical protein
MILIAILMFAYANQDFLEFAETYQNQGYTWEYVGKTPAEPGYPHLEVLDSENNPVYYYQLFSPKTKTK